MRELHGVVYAHFSDEQLKKQLLMFDRLYIIDFQAPSGSIFVRSPQDWEFLEARGLARKINDELVEDSRAGDLGWDGKSPSLLCDLFARYIASLFDFAKSEFDVVAACQSTPPTDIASDVRCGFRDQFIQQTF